MPSTLHEALVLLFRESPRLAPMLVARALGVDVGFGVGPGVEVDVQVTSAEFADLDPPEYRADLVLRIRDGSGGDDATREVFIIEVQLAPDPDKDLTWPMYAASVRARDRCPVTLVVLTLRDHDAVRAVTAGGRRAS